MHLNKCPLIFAAIVVLILILPAGSSAQNHETMALNDITAKIQSELPRNLPLSRIVVLPFEGDKDQKLRKVVEAKLVSLELFTVLERQQLDQILAEDSISVQPYIDPSSVSDLAGRLGAEGIFLGKVNNWKVSQGVAKLSASFKLVEVSTLKILWSKEYSIEAKSGWGRIKYKILIFLLFILVAIYIIGKQLFKDKEDELKRIEDIREKVKSSLKESLRDIEHVLVKAGDSTDTDYLSTLKKCSKEIASISERLKQRAFGQAGAITPNQIKEMITRAKTLSEKTGKLRDVASAIRSAILQDAETVSGKTDELVKLISEIQRIV